MNVLWKFSYRHVLGRPGRAILTLLSIVIGVAAVVSVTIATATTRQAYTNLFATVTGRAQIEVVAEGGGTFDQAMLQNVLGVPGVEIAVPVVQRPTLLYLPKGRQVKLLAMGIDPTVDDAVRDYKVEEGRIFGPNEDAVLLEANFARSIGVGAGDEVKLLGGSVLSGGLRKVTVVGLLAPQGAAAMRIAGTMFIPLQRAQAWFGAKGKLDMIQIVCRTEKDADVGKPLAEILTILPTGITARRPAAQSQVMEENLRSSEEGLKVATAFSLLLAGFIILNTFLMNIGERRRQMAIMRSIGATSKQISRMVFGESIAMGILGTILGIVLGIGGAYVLSQALTKLMQMPQPPMQLSVWPFVLAAGFGMGISLVGAWMPAWRASKLSPIEGLAAVPPSDMEGASPIFTVMGVITSLISGGILAGCIQGWLPIQMAVSSAVALMIGIVLLVPEVLSPLSQTVSWCLGPIFRVEALLAHRQVLRHRTRSTLTMGVLFVASASGIGLASAILDNVQDVRRWYETALQGDFFIRATMPDMKDGTSAVIPADAGKEIRAVPGIAALDTGRMVAAEMTDGRSVVVIIREFTVDRPVYFDLRGGDRDTIRQRLFDGDVVIGTVLAQKSGLGLGDRLPLRTRQGVKELKIAGITNEYMVGGLAVYMERKVAERLLEVQGYDAYVVYADEGKLDEVKASLQSICEKYGVILHSNADIVKMIKGMIAGIDGALWGILALCFVVAAIGVVNTLTMNVLEQTRELGLLRIVAMTRRQVRRTILAQAIILGTIGLLPGTTVGLGVAYLMHLATQTVLGHPVAFVFRPGMLAGAFCVGLSIIIIAAMIPAERAARLVVSKALQYE